MSDSIEPENPPAPALETEPAPREPRRVLCLVPELGREPSSGLAAEIARQVWALVSAPWHPSALARLERLPELIELGYGGETAEGDVVLWPAAAEPYLTAPAYASARDAGSIGIETGEERTEVARALIEALGGEPGGGADDDPFVLDFQALGTARWWLLELTRAMQHADCLDHTSLEREALAGARAWASGDLAGARNRLRAAFELMTEAREKYYPVDAYFVDLHLLEADAAPGLLDEALEARVPFTILATAQAIESLAAREPAAIEKLREGITEGWADVIGGPYRETDEPLRPLASLLWQLAKGEDVYREHLDDRTVETLASRRFALHPLKPAIAKRHGFRHALHLGFDAGQFPTPRESKRLWESPDGSSLEALTRAPAAADRPQEGLRLPWRLARSMKDDHVAVVPLAHWAGDVAPWFRDLRRVAIYSPVLARWVTAGDFFHLTDRPYDALRAKLDEYKFPYLQQAVVAGNSSPIGERVVHAAARADLDAAETLLALAWALDLARGDGAEPPGEDPRAIEEAVEIGTGADEAAQLLARAATSLAEQVMRGSADGPGGALVFNPAGMTRRVAVVLPGFDLPPPKGGAVHAAQLTEQGVEAVVTVPGLGFAWVGKPAAFEPPDLASSPVSAKGHELANELVSVEIDSKTGGLRAIMGAGEDSARIAQQLVLLDPRVTDEQGKPRASRMVADRHEPEYGGPALVQAVTQGRLLHPVEDRPLALFRQRVRLWAGRPIAEVEIELDEIDEGWLGGQSPANAWESYIACRWAWPDVRSTLRRCCFLGAEATEADRPETAEAIDITGRRHRTTLLFGGLAHHKKNGARMLDTLLIAGGESARRFKLGVALDLEHPFQAIADLWTPAPVARVEGPGSSAWLYRVDMKNVAVLRVGRSAPEQGAPGPALAFDLIETAGRSCRARLRCFREPAWARQIDLRGELVVDLAVDGDSVLLDFTPRELARIEVGFS